MLADRVIFVFIVLLAALYFYATAQIPELEIGDPLGPKAFPELLGIALLVTAAFLAVEMVRNRRAKAPPEAEPVAAEPRFDRHGVMVVSAVTVWTFLYFVVFEPLGYAIASVLYLVPMMAYFHRGKWVSNIVTSVIFSFGSYWLFTHALGVTLARGILPF